MIYAEKFNWYLLNKPHEEMIALLKEEVIKEEVVESFTSSQISGKYYYCDCQITAYLF